MIDITYELLLSLNIVLWIIGILLAIWLFRFTKWWETDKKAAIAIFLSFALIGIFVTGGCLLEYSYCETCGETIKIEDISSSYHICKNTELKK